MLLALVNDDGGLRLDAVLTALPDIATLFGATRSYIHADLAPVSGAVRFLAELMPGKPLDELYTVLGRARQGKTERWRALDAWLRHNPRPVSGMPRASAAWSWRCSSPATTRWW